MEEFTGSTSGNICKYVLTAVCRYIVSFYLFLLDPHTSFLPRYAVILAFDVRIEREAQEMADTLGVRIFSAEIIYHLFDAFTKYRQDYKKQKQEEFK